MLAQTSYPFGIVSDDVSDVTSLLRDVATVPAVPSVFSVQEAAVREASGADGLESVLVFIASPSLPAAAPVVSSAAQRHRLNGLIVSIEDPRWYPQLLDRSGLRTVRNTLVHAPDDLPVRRRILNAHMIGAQHDLVARAQVEGDTLVALTCAFRTVEVPFDAHPALRRLPLRERSRFHLSKEGHRLSWLDGRIELDLDGLRYASDPQYRDAVDLQNAIQGGAYGDAVRSLRVQSGLRQVDVPGLSERQVRRVERDGTGSLDALRALAEAHKLPLTTYLDALAERVADLGL